MEENQDAKFPPSLDVKEKEARNGAKPELVNTSGHVQEIDRTFGLFSICAMAVMSDNAWGAGGGSLVIS